VFDIIFLSNGNNKDKNRISSHPKKYPIYLTKIAETRTVLKEEWSEAE